MSRGLHPCGCVDTRDFKGYGVRQLCDEHFAAAAEAILTRPGTGGDETASVPATVERPRT